MLAAPFSIFIVCRSATCAPHTVSLVQKTVYNSDSADIDAAVADWYLTVGNAGAQGWREPKESSVVAMEPLALYRTFSHELFYNFHKHSTDLELEELGKKYDLWLKKNEQTANAILEGKQPPGQLRPEAREELEFLARMEAKFPNELPQNIRGEHFESETGFSSIEGKLRRLVEGRTHLVRLIKPSEYDKNYWFYSASDTPPQHVFSLEFGLDMIEFLKGVSIADGAKLRNLGRAIAFRRKDVYQFWALAPYLHLGLTKLGFPWQMSMATIMKIAGRRYSQEGAPFAGSTRFQLGYDERMPTHLLAYMEAMRDVRCVKRGEYAERYGIAVPEGLNS